MENKLILRLLLICAIATPYLSSAQGFIGNGTSNGIKAVNSSGNLTGVNVGIGVATPTSGTTLEVREPGGGSLGLKFDLLPSATTPYVLYYDGTAAVTYGAAPSGTISSVDYDCGDGTITINGVTSSHRAWLLSGSATNAQSYFGTFNDDDIRISTNNSSCNYASLKEKMIIGSETNNGNISIGWDGVTTLPLAASNSKLLVQNGTVSAAPYTAIAGFPLASSDIGIYSYGNNSASGNNAGVASVIDATRPLQVGYIAVVKNATNNNVGMYAQVSSTATGVNNSGISADISGDNASNRGAEINVDGNGSDNSGVNVNVGTSSSTSTNNTGINVNTAGSSTLNMGINLNVSTNSTSGNIGASSNVSGNSTVGQNAGFTANVTGTTAGNYGLLVNASGSPQGNYGADGTASGDGNNLHNHGVFGQAYGSGVNLMNFGVYGRTIANPSSSNANSFCSGVFGSIDPGADGAQNYGVVGDLIAITSPLATTPYYSIYARQVTPPSSYSNTITSISSSYLFGGYFEGDVFASNYYYPSDPKLKDNVEDLGNALDALSKLPVKQYTFRTAEYAKMNLPEGRQFGIMATDFKKVFPSLVKGALHKANGTGDKDVFFDAVNYNALIPVLVEAVKELKAKGDNNELAKAVADQQSLLTQQTQIIADQGKQIADLRSMIDDLCTNGCGGFNPKGAVQTMPIYSATLFQSIPNPASGVVNIGYSITMAYSKAAIIVMTMDGKLIADYKITGQGAGSISFDTNTLAAGVYKYYLTVDGKILDTKSMAVTAK